MLITATRTFRLGATTYTSGQSYTVADAIADRLIKRGWASGTPAGSTALTMSQDWLEGTTRYLTGANYTIPNPLGDFLVQEGLAAATGTGTVPTGISFSGGSVLDNAPVGTLVGTATVTMSDGSPFAGTLSLTINPNSEFAIDAAGHVTVAAALPAGASTPSITIHATQNGTSVDQPVTISVNDHNLTAVTSLGILSTPSNPGSGGALSNVLVSHGMPFKKGDIPAGFVPRVFAHGGSQLSAQGIDHEKFWSDGSLKYATLHYQVPSLPGTASLTDPMGNPTSALFDVKAVSGSETHTGITLAAFQSWASANGWNVTWSLTIDGVAYTADANTALAGSSTWSNTAPSFRGIWTKNPLCTEFVATMPVWTTSGHAPHRILLAGFHVRVYHPGGTIQDVRTDPYIENGNVASVGNGCVPIESITLKQGNAVVWSRTAVTSDAALNIAYGAFSGSSWATQFCSAYVTGGTFTFDPSHAGRVINANGQLIYIRDANQPTIVVTAKGSGYTSAPTVNSGGTAVLAATVASGGVQSVTVTAAGTVGTISFSGGGGTGAAAVVKNPDGYVVTAAGSGFTSNPTVANSNSNAAAVIGGGSVVAVYPTLPTQLGGAPSITGGGGTGAQVLAHVSPGITGITGFCPQTLSSICKTQSPTGGSLTLNGQCVSGGVAYVRMEGGRTVRFYSASDNSGATFTINGVRTDTGASFTETGIVGPTAHAHSYSAYQWETISSINYTGSNPANIQVGHGGQAGPSGALSSLIDVTYGITVPSTGWKILGLVIPNRTRLTLPALRTWHNVVPRHYVAFDNYYLVSTRVIQNYAIDEPSAATAASTATTQRGTLDGLPGISAPTTCPDGRDYSPFYYTGPDGNHFGYFLFESTSGVDAGIGSDSSFELYWLISGTWDAWRSAHDRAHSIFASPIFHRDENTGLPLDPAIRTNYAANGSTGPQPTFSPQFYAQRAVGVDNYYGNFSWWNTDIAHSNAKCRLTYLLTGDLKFLEALQHNVTARWLLLNNNGNGLNRSCWGPSANATAQPRQVSWFFRDLIHATIHAPDSPYTSGIVMDTSPSGSLRTLLSNWLSQGYSALVTGPDGYGITAAQKGDCHWWGSNHNTVMWQVTYNAEQFCNLYENELLDTNGQALFDWLGDLLYQAFANPGVQARYLGYVTNFPFVHKGGASYGYVTSMADLWSAFLEYFPSNGNTDTNQATYTAPGPIASLSIASGDATVVGNTVTFQANTPVFYADHVTGFIAGTQRNITVLNASAGTVTLTAHGYSEGQPVRVSSSNGAFPTSLAPRTTYYAHVVDVNTLQLFTSAAMTTNVTFSSTSSLRIYAGEARITATNASGSSITDTVTATIIAPFPNNNPLPANTQGTGTNWILSGPATVTSPQQVVHMWPHGGLNNGGVIPEYSLTWRWGIAALSALPARYSACKAAYSTIKSWCDADNIIATNNLTFMMHSCKPR